MLTSPDDRFPLPGALVCVVDDEEPIRQSLCRLFRSVGQPARAFPSAAEYLEHSSHEGPCCVLLDVNMPGTDGFKLHKSLFDRPEQVVFFTGHGNVPMCARAMKSGAVDFLTKPVDDEVLLDAVSRALNHSAQRLEENARRSEARSKMASLTPREAAVMHCVIAGMLNKQIAADFGITEKTVKVHRGRVMRKTCVVSVPELVRLAIAADLPPQSQQ